MSDKKCNLCGMKVLNIEVHMKLNHKKKKSAKTEGFRFTGFSSSTSPNAAALLPSITKYQNTQYKHQYKDTKEISNTTDKSDTVETSQSSSQCNDEANHSEHNEECLQKSLAMLGNLMDQEKARQLYKLNGVTDSDMNDIFKSGSITKEAFEVKLRLLGMTRIGNTYKKKEDRSVKYCPDCGQAFHWVKQRRGENREYFDHIKTCGLQSNYSNFQEEKNETREQMVNLEKIEQLEPEINIFVKKEIEIKTEISTDVYEIAVKKETVDTNDDDLEAEYGEQLMLKKLQVIQEPIERFKSNLKHITAPEIDLAIKYEREDASNIDFETNYGEQLMLKKCQVKAEPFDGFSQERPTEGLTEVKTERDLWNDFETPSIEPISGKIEESFGEPLGMLDIVNIGVLDELVKDTDTISKGAQELETDKLASKSQTENIGDAWFKKISEIERKTFTCDICVLVFKKFGLLVNHQRARHGILESQVFLDCDECSKSFNTVKKLNRHKKSHKIKDTIESRKPNKNSLNKPIWFSYPQVFLS